MAAPHNPARYGELWPQDRIDSMRFEIVDLGIGEIATLSGGWAWHFLSPVGHPEYKHAHDHKDIDVFIEPEQVGFVFERLFNLGYHREATRYDGYSKYTGIPFYRFAKETAAGHKIVIDLFVQQVPYIEVQGVRVVEPTTLLGFYDLGIQASSQCFAVTAARKLLSQGISPVGRPELVEIPRV